MKKIYAGLVSVIFFNVFAMHEGMRPIDFGNGGIDGGRTSKPEPIDHNGSRDRHQDDPNGATTFSDRFHSGDQGGQHGNSGTPREEPPSVIIHSDPTVSIAHESGSGDNGTDTGQQRALAESVIASTDAPGIGEQADANRAQSTTSSVPAKQVKPRTLKEKINYFLQEVLHIGSDKDRLLHRERNLELATTPEARAAALKSIDAIYDNVKNDVQANNKILLDRLKTLDGPVLAKFTTSYDAFLQNAISRKDGFVQKQITNFQAVKPIGDFNADLAQLHQIGIEAYNVQDYIVSASDRYRDMIDWSINLTRNAKYGEAAVVHELISYFLQKNTKKLNAKIAQMNESASGAGDRYLAEAKALIKRRFTILENSEHEYVRNGVNELSAFYFPPTAST